MAISHAARANRYARAVTSSKIPAGRLLQSACARHLSDLEKARTADYPYRFDPKAVERICEFAENMVHIKGEWAKSKPDELPFIHLEDWQCFLLGGAFGWLRKKDGLRRFRELYWEIPRKNSKSTLGAIIGLYMAFAEKEQGAVVLSGATSMKQAMMVFETAWLMVKKNPEFQEFFGLGVQGSPSNPGTIYQLSTSSRFEPIIGSPGDGENVHCAIIDEYHEHPTPVMYDAMKTGMGSRSQPMRAIVTTAGTNTSGPCYDKRLEAVKILNGSMENDQLFTCVYAADIEENWQDFEVWRKVNPNIGVSVNEDYLQSQLRDAMQNISQQNIIRTKHLNQWMNAGVGWMDMPKWEACRRPEMKLQDFARQPCWMAFDLANKIDIASLAFIFKLDWGIAFFAKHYLPEETIELAHNSHYRKWRDEGWLIQTDGARTDHRRIEDDIKAASKLFAVQALAYDPREANYLVASIEEWASFDCLEITQGPTQMSEPMKEMEAAIYSGQLRHCGDPVLTWMMGNVIKKQGHASGSVKYYYPAKERDANKIDGVVAGIMALGRAMSVAPEPKFQAFFV